MMMSRNVVSKESVILICSRCSLLDKSFILRELLKRETHASVRNNRRSVQELYKDPFSLVERMAPEAFLIFLIYLTLQRHFCTEL